METKLEPIDPDCGDLMTVQEFIEDVESGCLTDDDGYGEWATDKEVSNRVVNPSDVDDEGKLSPPEPKFTHVCWYNQ